LYDQSAPHGYEREAGTETHLRLLEHARHVRVNGDTSRGALAASRGMCEWKSFSKMELTKADDLTRIAGLGRAVREKVETFAGTVTGLAGLDPMSFPLLPGVGPDRLRRFVERDGRISDPTAGPIVRMPPNLPRPGHGIDFDVEADPLRKLMYVYGLWHVVGGEGRFVHFFAETADEAGEHEAFAEAISHFRKYRNAHWVHYSAYERTAYRALQQRHPMVREVEQIDLIIAAERCTDLYPIIAQHTDWPLSSYGIKSVVRACGFEWEDADPGSANCIEWYEGLVETDDTALRDHIVAHNRDDVIDSQVVGDALDELETTGMIAAFRRPAK
ncbi:MAG: TM0106 family RecB-like putative nuclease, partial [Alphaproteobacteria bacterium]